MDQNWPISNEKACTYKYTNKQESVKKGVGTVFPLKKH